MWTKLFWSILNGTAATDYGPSFFLSPVEQTENKKEPNGCHLRFLVPVMPENLSCETSYVKSLHGY